MATFLDCNGKRAFMSELFDELDQERIWIEQSKRNISRFKPLYNKYYDPLYRFFLRRTDDEHLTQDLCSQTFFKSLDQLHQFQWQGKPFGAWLFKIGHNMLRKHFRDQKPIYVIEEDKINCIEGVDEPNEPDYIEMLIRLLDDLPEIELRLLELKYFEKCSFKEIGILLEMGESAVKMRLYRLLNKLKALLERDHDEARF